MARIYITRRIPEPAEEMLRTAGHECDVNPEDRVLSREELHAALKAEPYEGILCLLTDTIDAAALDAAPNVKIVANYAVGFNNIDVEEAKRRGVTVTNTPGALTESVAEHTVALILALSTRTVEGDRLVREGKFSGWDPMLLLGADLKGKTLGILGAGRIGERVTEILVRGFGMKALYYDVKRNERIESECGAAFRETPEEVLQEADVVSVHVPLLESTKHLINDERLARMRKEALLVNTSRGPVIDEKALAEALEKRVIAGAALDVFEFEPAVERKLLSLPNTVLTPHIASATESARREMAELVAQNLIDFFSGKVPKNLV